VTFSPIYNVKYVTATSCFVIPLSGRNRSREYCCLRALRNTVLQFSGIQRVLLFVRGVHDDLCSRLPMVISLSLRRSGIDPKLFYVVFVVEEVAVGQFFVQVLGSFQFSIHFVNLPPTLYGRRN
jgi:hypothetical protein